LRKESGAFSCQEWMPRSESGNFQKLLGLEPFLAYGATRRTLGHGKGCVGGGSKVFVEREQRIRFQLPEGAAEDLLDPVDPVKEVAFFDFQNAAAKSPIRPQQVVITEERVLLIVKCTAAHQAEVGNIFLDFAAVKPLSAGSVGTLHTDSAHVLFQHGALSEANITGLKNCPENAFASMLISLAAAATYSKTLTIRALGFGQGDSFRTIPLHGELLIPFRGPFALGLVS